MFSEIARRMDLECERGDRLEFVRPMLLQPWETWKASLLPGHHALLVLYQSDLTCDNLKFTMREEKKRDIR